jgi:epoxyqueuosine reductase
MSREAAEAIRAAALEVGFTLAGLAPAAEPAGSRRLLDWLSRGYHGSMAWMARDPEARLDSQRILPGARTVVAVAVRYRHPALLPTGTLPAETLPAGAGPPAPLPAGAPPRISCYAWGDDYHEVMGGRLRRLEGRIRLILGEPLVTRLACDTSPVMDKAWAAAAGIGWLGKNACLVHPREGSWLFLGEIFLDRELPSDSPSPDRCGDCRRCLDACPTGALVAPRLLDARRCISNLTIEHRADFSAEEQAAVGDWLAGCDLCQEICPWNRRAPLSVDEAFAPRPELVERPVEEWAALGDAACREAVRGTALTRIKPSQMRRNARGVMENRARRS